MPNNATHFEAYRRRLFDGVGRYAWRGSTVAAADWQREARAAYRALMLQDSLGTALSGHAPTVSWRGEAEDCGDHTRRLGAIETEPGLRIGFWLLRPLGDGPCPLAITPHGHENRDSYVGIAGNEHEQDRIDQADQDVARQAVRRGFVVITSTTRGIGQDVDGVYLTAPKSWRGLNSCEAHNKLLIMRGGRHMMAERAWDLMRLLDWGLALPDVRADRVLMIGNSGGGMATLHTAALDPRVTMAVVNCAFNSYMDEHFLPRHCTCNLIPGISEFGEMWDVAGLVAPRHLLTLNGNADGLHPTAAVAHAADELAAIYRAMGAPSRYQHRFGAGGHRFFADQIWPWVDAAMATLDAEA